MWSLNSNKTWLKNIIYYRHINYPTLNNAYVISLTQKLFSIRLLSNTVFGFERKCLKNKKGRLTEDVVLISVCQAETVSNAESNLRHW
jgi:hypothetical protein